MALKLMTLKLSLRASSASELISADGAERLRAS